MRVRDIIEELQELDPNQEVEVFITCDRDGYEVHLMTPEEDGVSQTVWATSADFELRTRCHPGA